MSRPAHDKCNLFYLFNKKFGLFSLQNFKEIYKKKRRKGNMNIHESLQIT